MLRVWLTLAMLVVAVVIAGCESDGDAEPGSPDATARSTATATPLIPTPEPTPGPMNFGNIGVRAAMPQAEGLSEASFNALNYLFVLELASGLVQPVDINDESSAYGNRISRDNPIAWLDDDTLWLAHPSSTVEMDLDGTVREVATSPSTPALRGSGTTGQSPSGVWSVGMLSGNLGRVFASSQAPHDDMYRVAAAEFGVWAPMADVYALGGSPCAGWDLFVYEPVGTNGHAPGTLTNLTKDDPRRFWGPRDDDYAWSPDGVTLAAGANGTDPALVTIDTVTGTLVNEAVLGWDGEVYVMGWNPSGDRVLFGVTVPAQIDCSVPPYHESFLADLPGAYREFYDD